MYIPADPGSLEWSAKAPIVYPSQLLFIRVVSQGCYCIPQLTLACWGDQPGPLLYTSADSGLLEWSVKVSIVYAS